MSKQSDKRTTDEEIAYLEKVLAGLRGSTNSLPRRLADIDAEISKQIALRERLQRDAEQAPTLILALDSRLTLLRSLDFLERREVRGKIDKGSVADLRRQMLRLRKKMLRLQEDMDTLGITDKVLEAYSSE